MLQKSFLCWCSQGPSALRGVRRRRDHGDFAAAGLQRRRGPSGGLPRRPRHRYDSASASLATTYSLQSPWHLVLFAVGVHGQWPTTLCLRRALVCTSTSTTTLAAVRERGPACSQADRAGPLSSIFFAYLAVRARRRFDGLLVGPNRHASQASQ